jgi:hypothetical protein
VNEKRRMIDGIQVCVLDSDECCAKHGNAATLEVVSCLLMGDDLARSFKFTWVSMMCLNI